VSDNAIQARVTGDINTEFLYYYLINRELSALATKTAQPLLNQSTIGNVTLPKPTLEEQRKIASVLHNVDQAIQKTDEIIEQIKRTKAGIAQELFRYGFYEHETESRRLLGEIPEDWDIVRVGDICEKVTDGTHRAVPAQETGKPCLTAKNIRDWGFDLTDIKYISAEEHEDIISRCYPEKGDLLYVKDGANTGMVQVNTLDFEFSLLNSVILMKTDEEIIDPHFLEQMLSWEKMKKLIVARRTGTGIRRVTITNMKKSDVLLPPLEEQREMADILTDFDEQVAKEMELQERLQRLKQGLMQDLLSGEVRTTDTSIEVLDEVAQHG
jgi:type I restriction enzyme S subunit